MKLKRDVFSHVKPSYLYGHAGEEVIIIEDFGHMAIIEVNGIRFSCLKENLTEEEIEIEETKIIINPVRVAQRPQIAKPVPSQQSLF